MIGKDRAMELLERILWMTQDYVQLAGMPKSYGTGERFHSLDIHVIHSIGQNLGINVTGLAKKHGISKSAVSQVLRKLEKRGLVGRYQVPENRKEVLFELTGRGREAFEAHMVFHSEAEEPFLEEMSAFSEEDAAGMVKMLDLLTRRAGHVRKLLAVEEENHGKKS